MATKKKKVSKTSKSSWRKNVNIDDVEEFLEERRLEERVSGAPLEDLPDDKLFQIDTKPSMELLSSKERKKLMLSKPLKCFSLLKPHTKVPDPIAKRNRVRSKEERKNKLVKIKEENNRKNGVLKAKELLALKNRRLYELRKEQEPKRGDFTKDLWEDEQGMKSEIEKDTWASPDTKLNVLRGIGVVKKLKKSKKANKIKAIENPHPGSSYNPSYNDHQNLLKEVVNKELTLIKEEDHLKRVTTGMFQKVAVSTKDKQWLVEMSEGLPSSSSSEVKEEEASDDEYKSINPPVKNKKKTAQQRRKQKEQMKLEKAKLELKQHKKKITDIHRIKSLKEHLQNVENRQSVLQDIRKKKLESKKDKVKTLNARKYEEPDLEVNMTDEISGNLKNLKTQGNLLADRFKSMQKRNILAPSKRMKKERAKVKRYVKPGHKDEDWKKTVARQF